ncbi:LacI family DNA-binding transcriptional regulator [Paenibacillus graminis]|uniref:HTH lacI-type domain-containing protein n=1 Tax=Paenibacillus graminis TaxID=189425 RepID=A0A089M8J8_9BACL|nr:LacI family DNA-binding transcriptional regulator [Paenibacillus graminis]AIQ67828.1 hypothetical protein PGRAT_09450 [Paenibacillus graminis]
MPIRKKVTLQHLATELGLTVHTVSKALRGLPGMSEYTRNEVLLLAHKLGYHTKEQERSLLFENTPVYSRQSRRFIFLIAARQGLQSPLHHVLLESVQHRLGEAGHKVELLFVPEGLQPAKAFIQWENKHNLSYADGIFISPVIDESVEAHLIQRKMPRILLNFPPPGANVDSVIWNVHDAMQQSARHLIAMGHRRIMYIGNPWLSRGYQLRWQAFCMTLEAAGIQAEPDSHIFEMNQPQEEWTALWKRQTETYKPTAFICASEQALTRVYLACQTTGKRIPGDYSLIGLEPEPSLRNIIPDIARPTLPVKETGYRAADRMLWRIANPSLPYEHILLQGGLHNGSTVQPAHAEEPRGKRGSS